LAAQQAVPLTFYNIIALMIVATNSTSYDCCYELNVICGEPPHQMLHVQIKNIL